MLGMAIRVMGPGEPSTYHWETEQEDFLVLGRRCSSSKRKSAR
jgi:hypothetical protein